MMKKNSWKKIGLKSNNSSASSVVGSESRCSQKREFQLFDPLSERNLGRSISKRSLNRELHDTSLDDRNNNLQALCRSLSQSKISQAASRNEKCLEANIRPSIFKSAVLGQQTPMKKTLLWQDSMKVQQLRLRLLKQSVQADISQLKRLFIQVKMVVSEMLKMLSTVCKETTYHFRKIQSEYDKKIESQIQNLHQSGVNIQELQNGLTQKYKDLDEKSLKKNTSYEVTTEATMTPKTDHNESDKKQQKNHSRQPRVRSKGRQNIKRWEREANPLSQTIQKMKNLLNQRN